jgi:hypothetical protein
MTIGSIAISYPNIQAQQKNMDLLKNQIASNNQQTELLNQSRDFEQRQSKIAESRYEKGCIPVVAKNNPRKYVGLVERRPVLDQVSKQPLPVGSIVCDAHGNTGVVIRFSEEVGVGNMAFTGNRKIVMFRLKNYKGSSYSQPVN